MTYTAFPQRPRRVARLLRGRSIGGRGLATRLATRLVTASALLGIGIAGCSPAVDPAGDAGPPPAPFADLPFAPGGCGAPAYSWLPDDEVGSIVLADAHPLSPLTRGLVTDLLADAGMDGIGEAEHDVELFTLRYGTQDRGAPVEATGLVAIPALSRGAPAEFPVLLWLHGTTGFTGVCAPSRLGGENLGIALLASFGFIVVAPDYIGIDADLPAGEVPPVVHAYLGLEQAALGSLDMVRAAKALLSEIPTGATPSLDTILWGGSQGGHAAFAVDRLAPYYAPELEVKAMVALVPPTDLLAQARYALSSLNPASGAFPASMTSLARWHGQAEALPQALQSEGPVNLVEELPRIMDTTCDFSGYADAIDSLDDIFVPEFLAKVADFAEIEPWGCMFQRNSIVDTDIPLVRTTPTLFQISQNDTLVHADTERQSFAKLCAQGYRLHFLECADAGHTQGALWSLPEQIAFVNAHLGRGPHTEAPLCEVQPPVRCSGTPGG